MSQMRRILRCSLIRVRVRVIVKVRLGARDVTVLYVTVRGAVSRCGGRRSVWIVGVNVVFEQLYSMATGQQAEMEYV